MKPKKQIQQTINLDGIRIQLQPPDRESNQGDAELIEQAVQDHGIQEVVNKSELEGSLEQLNNDLIESDTRMSGIDMRARLHPMEIASVLALDALVQLKVLPSNTLGFSRQKKRLSVSLDGKGRQEIVDIVGGKREQDAKMGGMGGFGDRMKQFMTGGQ